MKKDWLNPFSSLNLFFFLWQQSVFVPFLVVEKLACFFDIRILTEVVYNLAFLSVVPFYYLVGDKMLYIFLEML